MIYISNYIIPTIILIVIIFGILEKIEIFNTFCDGAKEGLKIAVMMFPTLLGVFICIGMLKNSGIIEKSVKLLRPLSLLFCIPTEIIPMIIIKPLSGGATLAMATDLMVKYGVDSKIGMLAATIMSSSETTFYVIALYLNSVHILHLMLLIQFSFLLPALNVSSFSLILIITAHFHIASRKIL